MPIFEFTDKQLLQGKLVTPGWYRMKIDNVGEASSKDGGSTNYPVEGTVICNADDGTTEFTGVPLTWNFNSKALGFAIGFLSALGVEVEAGKRYDINAAVGKEIDVFIDNDTYQNRLVNRINHKYRPVK